MTMIGTTGGSTMQDKIETHGNTVLQHGKINDRIYLMKLGSEDGSEVIGKLDELAIEKGYSKIVAKIQPHNLPLFLVNGYSPEAFIPRFYQHRDDCIFVSKFFDRRRSESPVRELKVFNSMMQAFDVNNISQNRLNHYSPAELKDNDTPEIARVFENVFASYPFPVFDPDYLVETMQKNGTRYFGIRENDQLIGVSTSEIDAANRNAEMTDFAVLPRYRGQKLASRLLHFMEEKMKISNIHTVYTIARLNQPGMNKTFLNAGYTYTGTLINNTNIGGSIESMNVLYKHL